MDYVHESDRIGPKFYLSGFRLIIAFRFLMTGCDSLPPAPAIAQHAVVLRPQFMGQPVKNG